MNDEAINETKMEGGRPLALPTDRSFKWNPGRIFLGSVLVSLAVSSASLYLYDRYLAQKIVAVDLQSFLREQKESYLRGELDDDGLKRRMDHLEQSMDAIPDRYAVILGDVVVRNVEVLKP